MGTNEHIPVPSPTFSPLHSFSHGVVLGVVKVVRSLRVGSDSGPTFLGRAYHCTWHPQHMEYFPWQGVHKPYKTYRLPGGEAGNL